MKQVLLFPEFHQEQLDHEALFLTIISYERPNIGQQLSSLSPKIMEWKAGVWIVNLGYCSNYWNTLATQSSRACSDIWKSILQDIFQNTSYYSALSFHPWQSLLLGYSLEEAGMKGLIHIDSIQGKNIYPHISWSSWWRAGEEYGEHKYRGNKSPQQKLRQCIKKMRLGMKRLGCSAPLHMHQTPPSQMKRRFGSDIERLWGWTYHYSKDKILNLLDLEEPFPWADYSWESKTEVRRNLDYPSFHWNDIESHLVEDLNSLCLSPSFNKGEHIMSLEWRVVLSDLSKHPVLIQFRNPHNLHNDFPHQRTALLQIQYLFEKQKKNLNKISHDLDMEPLSIVSWSLIIQQKILPNHVLDDLFESQNTDGKDILKLENQLEKPLLSYKTLDHWTPEDSYTQSSQGHDNKSRLQQHIYNHRPLFTYTKPQPLQRNSVSGSWKFTERTMDKWWQSKSRNKRRDYYHYTSHDHRYWVFRTSRGDWYIHGIFA